MKARKNKKQRLTPAKVGSLLRASVRGANELNRKLKRVFRSPDNDLRLD